MHSFPFLSTEEFVSGCKDLEEAFEASSDAIDTWSTLETRSGVSRHVYSRHADPL